jgi:hypothetical protein
VLLTAVLVVEIIVGFMRVNHSRLFVFSEIPKILYYWSWHGVLGIVEDPDWAHHLYRLYMAAVRRLFT